MSDRDALLQVQAIVNQALGAPATTPPVDKPPATGGGTPPPPFVPPAGLVGPNRWFGERLSISFTAPGQEVHAWYMVPAGWPGKGVPYGLFLINWAAMPSGSCAVFVDGVPDGMSDMYQQGNDPAVPVNPLLLPDVVHHILVRSNHQTSGSIDFNRDPR